MYWNSKVFHVEYSLQFSVFPLSEKIVVEYSKMSLVRILWDLTPAIPSLTFGFEGHITAITQVLHTIACSPGSNHRYLGSGDYALQWKCH